MNDHNPNKEIEKEIADICKNKDKKSAIKILSRKYGYTIQASCIRYNEINKKRGNTYGRNKRV